MGLLGFLLNLRKRSRGDLLRGRLLWGRLSPPSFLECSCERCLLLFLLLSCESCCLVLLFWRLLCRLWCFFERVLGERCDLCLSSWPLLLPDLPYCSSASSCKTSFLLLSSVICSNSSKIIGSSSSIG